jgi:hypothetical protein
MGRLRGIFIGIWITVAGAGVIPLALAVHDRTLEVVTILITISGIAVIALAIARPAWFDISGKAARSRCDVCGRDFNVLFDTPPVCPSCGCPT